MHTMSQLCLLGTGFRPFFLLGPLLGIALVPIWVAMFRGTLTPPPGLDALAWHRHEMLFGYTAAILAGFLLTAVPNWTGTPPVAGSRLLALVGLWIAGRVALVTPLPGPAWLPALVDLAFLPALVLVLLPPLRRSGKLPNLAFVPILLALTLCNLVIHLDALEVLEGGGARATRVTLDLIVLVMLLIGGRVIPYFVRRALDAPVDEPALGWRLAHAAAVGMVLARILGAPLGLRGTLALIAALAGTSRFLRWQRREAWRRPILWILYLGYAWVLLGLALAGVSDLTGAVHPRAAVHLYTVGGIGTLTLGMMARVALGHTGRELRVSRTTTAAFLAISLAAGLRGLGPLLHPEAYLEAVRGSAGLWSLAFALYLAAYTPVLVSPRVDGRPG